MSLGIRVGFLAAFESLTRFAALGWIVGISALIGPTTSLAAAPVITDVQAVGTAVQIKFFRGTPAPLNGALDVVITSPLCGELGRVSTPTPSEMAVGTVPSALASALACGPQYSASLEDGVGPVGAPLTFRLDLTCDPSNVCAYTLTPGLELTNALVATSDLTQALNQGAGSGNLVAAVLVAQPQLRDEVMSYALQLDRLLNLQGSGWGSGCKCVWVGSVEQTGLLGGHDTYYLWADEDATSADDNGYIGLETDLRCYASTGMQVLSVDLAGQTVHTIPAFDRCWGPVPAAGVTVADFETVAKAGGTTGYRAESDSLTKVRFDDVPEEDSELLAIRPIAGPLEVSASKTLAYGPISSSRVEIEVDGSVSVVVGADPAFRPNLGACLAGGLTLRSADLATGGVIVYRVTTEEDRDATYPEGEDPVACREVNHGGTVHD